MVVSEHVYKFIIIIVQNSDFHRWVQIGHFSDSLVDIYYSICNLPLVGLGMLQCLTEGQTPLHLLAFVQYIEFTMQECNTHTPHFHLVNWYNYLTVTQLKLE